MRKGIDGLCGIISEDLGHNPLKPKSVYVFSGRNPREKKVLIREYNRYELTTIRLDGGRFLRSLTDPERVGGKICWSDFVMSDRVRGKHFYGGKIHGLEGC